MDEEPKPTPGQVITPNQAVPVTPAPEPAPVSENKPMPSAEPMADAPQEPEEMEPDFDNDSQPNSDTPANFSWQASEFIHHQKNGSWYVLFGLAVIILIGVAVITKQWFSVAVFIAMAGALAVYAGKEPRTLSYQMDEKGVMIEDKLYPYNKFRSFAVFNDVAWHSIDLDPMQRFAPRLSILFESQDLDTILGILSAHLPKIDREPDLIDRVTRTLKF